jgi:predicted glutamine amidotransferase
MRSSIHSPKVRFATAPSALPTVSVPVGLGAKRTRVFILRENLPSVCRLFAMSGGSRRVGATFWLLDAPDSLDAQSRREPDGTGLGAYDRQGGPLVHHSALPAYEDREFARAARYLHSTTFIAHVRFASGSPVALENTHPFEQDGRLFAHNGVFRGLDELEEELGPGLELVRGATDSERLFALVTREIARADGDVEQGLITATRWVAEHLPIYALNLVLATADGIWALRYPETHELYVLERAGGSRFHSQLLQIQMHDPVPAVVVASERLDDDPGWRLLEPGELVNVAADLVVRSRVALPEPPAHQLTYHDLHPDEAASQHT